MKLTDRQLAHALAALGCSDAQSDDDRGRVRIPPGTRATIIPCGDASRGELTTIAVLNLSNTGIGILHANSMRTGAKFILRLGATPSDPATAILCVVMYSQSFANSMFAMGAQFVRVISSARESAPEACKPQAARARTSDLGEVPTPFGDVPDTIPVNADLAHIREVEDRLSRLSL
jgi:hypothetical protein